MFKFFILHNINMGFSSLWPIYPQNFLSADFYLHADLPLIFDMTAEHGNFTLFQTKRILDIVVSYLFSNNGVEILHST